jgi:hypothetical protein
LKPCGFGPIKRFAEADERGVGDAGTLVGDGDDGVLGLDADGQADCAGGRVA